MGLNRRKRRYTVQLALAAAVSFRLYSQPPATALEPPQVVTASVAVLQGDERVRFVAAHNAARTAVGVDSLTWSDALADVALESLHEQEETLIRKAQQGWATGQISLPTHRQDYEYGENIAAWAGTRRQPTDYAVALWLREKSTFDLLNSLGTYRVGDELPPPAAPDEKQPPPLIVGHYTQIVWRTTRQLGAAQLVVTLADDRDTRHYVAIICNYSPPGNRHGQPPY
jgi:hypothetical protein